MEDKQKYAIFAGFGARSEFVNLIYTELMKREFVSYADILAIYCKRPKGYYEKRACNSEPGYGELKKAFPEVLKALRSYDSNCILKSIMVAGSCLAMQIENLIRLTMYLRRQMQQYSENK